MENCKNCIFYVLWYDEQRQEDDDKIIIGQEKNADKHFCFMYEKGIPHEIWENKTKCQHKHKK